MAMYDDPADTRRRKNIVPRSRSFFPAASRFMGGLEPSPTGSYFNPARYGNDLTPSQLRFAQRNLANVYNQDVQFNRVANPRFQTEQDIGTSATAPFGSGRATAATTQRYAQRYGRPTADGLITFDTPSGGSITYRPTARQLAGGLEGGGAQPLSSGTQGTAPESPFMQNVMEGLPTLSTNAMNQVQYGVPPALSGIPSDIARPAKTPRAATPSAPGYHFGQNVRRGAWDVAAGLGNVGIYGRNLLYRPAANVFAGAFGLQPTQPMRYFDF